MREPGRVSCTCWSSQKLGEDGTRDGEVFRGEAQAIAFQVEEA